MQYLKTKLGYNSPGYTVTAFAHTLLDENMYCVRDGAIYKDMMI